MSPEEIAFFDAAKPVIRRLWWEQNKMLAECVLCDGSPSGKVPDDGISPSHDEACVLKNAILAYWAMIEKPLRSPVYGTFDPEEWVTA